MIGGYSERVDDPAFTAGCDGARRRERARREDCNPERYHAGRGWRPLIYYVRR